MKTPAAAQSMGRGKLGLSPGTFGFFSSCPSDAAGAAPHGTARSRSELGAHVWLLPYVFYLEWHLSWKRVQSSVSS